MSCHTVVAPAHHGEGADTGGSSGPREAGPVLRVALAGNPNVGKTSLFNRLTGARQQVGNWPGKTVVRVEGLCRAGDTYIHVVDLPGTYSLSAYTMEEEVARDYIVSSEPDVVVAVVDATNLERNLYLVLQVLELTPRVVVALTMMDVARSEKLGVDVDLLETLLGVPVVSVYPRDSHSLDYLKSVIVDVGTGEKATHPFRVQYGPYAGGPVDRELLEAEARYEAVAAIARQVLHERPHHRLTQALDDIVLHRVFGLPILAVLAAGLFFVTFNLSAPAVDLLNRWFGFLGARLQAWVHWLGLPAWVGGFLANGMLGGVGSVLAFFPLMTVFFFLYAFLQDSGYLARAAFLTDRLLRAMGLGGRVFFSLLTGYGCNVPGVFATRIAGSEREREAAILVSPFVPCAARLGVMTFFTAAFFPGTRGAVVLLGLLALDILVIAAAGVLLERVWLRGEPAPFVLELPPYRWPGLQSLLTATWTQLSAFLEKAGTVIVMASAAIWLFTNIPYGAPVEHTVAGAVGRLLAPAGAVLGLNWQLMLALLVGVVAKETALSTLGVIFHAGSGAPLAGVLTQAISPLQAVTFLAVYMVYSPCVPTMTAMRRELGSWRWVVGGVALTLGMAFVTGLFVQVAGRLAGWGL